jgi:putative spermidine/putrescine transport system permease protein
MPNRRWTPVWLGLPALVMILGLVLGPVVFMVRMSLYERTDGIGNFTAGTATPANYERLLEVDSMKIVEFTVVFGATVALATVVIGFALALVLDSWPRRWRMIGLAIVVIPKLTNGLATVFGLKRILGEQGPINTILVNSGLLIHPIEFWPGTLGAAIAEVYFILPYVVVLLVLQLGRIDPRWLTAARGLGASRVQVFRRITWPLSIPGLLLAGQLSLMWGIGSLFGPQFLGNPSETTISVEVQHQAFDLGHWPRAAAWAVLLFAINGIAFALTGYLARRLR